MLGYILFNIKFLNQGWIIPPFPTICNLRGHFNNLFLLLLACNCSLRDSNFWENSFEIEKSRDYYESKGEEKKKNTRVASINIMFRTVMAQSGFRSIFVILSVFFNWHPDLKNSIKVLFR